MADIFDFYVYDDRSIQFSLAEPIMLEDKDVTQFRFRIPKVLNNIDMTSWEWWFIFVNAKKVKYTTQLTLEDDEDDPDNFSVATYTVGYGFSGYVGSVSFSIEALNISGQDVVNEWHTRTYNTTVTDTLQGTRAVVPEPDGQAGTGLTEAIKQALLQIAQKMAYIDEHGQTYYEALYNALYPPANLLSISAVYTQTISVYTDTSLDDLKPDLVVTAYYDDSSTRTVSQYMLSGTLEVGTSTITVSYSGKSTTFEVTVSRGTDYGEDALANATWESGKGYNTSTGALVTRSGAYATEKFSVQDLSYSVKNLDTTNNTNYYILLWDENDNYLGYKQYSDARFQWKPEYKIAVEVRNSGTFDPATMTMLPYDKRATAVSAFEIDIAVMANSVVKANGYYELNVKSAMAEVGVNSSNYKDTINRQSIIGMIDQSVYPNNFPFKTPIRIGTFNYNKDMLLSINVEGIAVSDANLPTLKQYLVDNNVKIQYNY